MDALLVKILISKSHKNDILQTERLSYMLLDPFDVVTYSGEKVRAIRRNTVGRWCVNADHVGLVLFVSVV